MVFTGFTASLRANCRTCSLGNRGDSLSRLVLRALFGESECRACRACWNEDESVEGRKGEMKSKGVM